MLVILITTNTKGYYFSNKAYLTDNNIPYITIEDIAGSGNVVNSLTQAVSVSTDELFLIIDSDKLLAYITIDDVNDVYKSMNEKMVFGVFNFKENQLIMARKCIEGYTGSINTPDGISIYPGTILGNRVQISALLSYLSGSTNMFDSMNTYYNESTAPDTCVDIANRLFDICITPHIENYYASKEYPVFSEYRKDIIRGKVYGCIIGSDMSEICNCMEVESVRFEEHYSSVIRYFASKLWKNPFSLIANLLKKTLKQ